MLQASLPKMSQILLSSSLLQSDFISLTTSRVSLLKYCESAQHYFLTSTNRDDSSLLAFLVIVRSDSNLKAFK